MENTGNVKIESLVSADGSVTMYFKGDNIKGGPVVSGSNEKEARKKLVTGLMLSAFTGLMEVVLKEETDNKDHNLEAVQNTKKDLEKYSDLVNC